MHDLIHSSFAFNKIIIFLLTSFLIFTILYLALI